MAEIPLHVLASLDQTRAEANRMIDFALPRIGEVLVGGTDPSAVWAELVKGLIAEFRLPPSEALGVAFLYSEALIRLASARLAVEKES